MEFRTGYDHFNGYVVVEGRMYKLQAEYNFSALKDLYKVTDISVRIQYAIIEDENGEKSSYEDVKNSSVGYSLNKVLEKVVENNLLAYTGELLLEDVVTHKGKELSYSVVYDYSIKPLGKSNTGDISVTIKKLVIPSRKGKIYTEKMVPNDLLDMIIIKCVLNVAYLFDEAEMKTESIL